MQFKFLVLLAACVYYASAVELIKGFKEELLEAVKNRINGQDGPAKIEGPELLLAEPYSLTRLNLAQGVLRVNLDGSSPVEIANYPKYRIKSVTLDLKNKRVFWADAKFHRVKSANYDGSDLKIALKNGNAEDETEGERFTLLGPANVAYHDGRIYIYDEMYRHISSVDVEGGADTYKIVYDRVYVKAMKIIAAEGQKPAARP